MTSFNIYNTANEIIARIHADNADQALNLFAAIVSGYDTFPEMMRSEYFNAKFLDVFAA